MKRSIAALGLLLVAALLNGCHASGGVDVGHDTAAVTLSR